MKNITRLMALNKPAVEGVFHQFGARMHVELVYDMFTMTGNRLRAERELLPDLLAIQTRRFVEVSAILSIKTIPTSLSGWPAIRTRGRWAISGFFPHIPIWQPNRENDWQYTHNAKYQVPRQANPFDEFAHFFR